MVFSRGRTKYFVLAAVVLILIGLAIGYYVSSLTPERKPLEIEEKPYEYYIIIDEASGKTLAFVATVVVSPGDEYLNEDGQWYEVVRVEENRAYARQFEKKQ
ncbi:stage II sporulation protein P [Anaeroselena agilis]|uniref:Stage II sporulation protein P n=1 Tax=Anaeroselena agilis TaxID=3063788 RepID=A0ABU3NTG6_9FIRM|nr:stage II sporulation protein P [Selenomonadales bacterium 4137-cl]